MVGPFPFILNTYLYRHHQRTQNTRTSIHNRVASSGIRAERASQKPDDTTNLRRQPCPFQALYDSAACLAYVEMFLPSSSPKHIRCESFPNVRVRVRAHGILIVLWPEYLPELHGRAHVSTTLLHPMHAG